MSAKQNQKLTAKQEKFAQLVAQGHTQSDAYREAYDAENMTNDSIKIEASRLMDNPNVSLTVDKLKQGAAKRNEVTLDECVRGIREAVDMAKTKDDVNAFIKAYRELGLLAGLYVEKKKVDGEFSLVVKVANEKDKEALERI